MPARPTPVKWIGEEYYSYIFHPLHVADQMPNSTLGAVGLLHDVVEDTPVTFVDLLAAGIPEDVVAAVKLLTHTPDDGLSYLEYVARLKDRSEEHTSELQSQR